MLLLGNLPPHPVYALQTIPKPSVSRIGNSYITARGVNETVTMAAAPPNFSWVEPKKLAGLAYPCTKGHYQFLFDSGIQHLVSLCESLPPHHDSRPGLQVHHIGIVDFTPPSYEQIKKFLSIVEEANSKDQGVGVHCMHGHGRTGTMLACYLVERKKISGDEAIKEIRRIRPGSIETNDQEKAVRDFHQNIQRG